MPRQSSKTGTYWYRALLSIAVTSALAGCNNREDWRFKEEVQLNTGKVTTLDHHLYRNNVWPHLGNGGYQSVMDQWLSSKAIGLSDWQESTHSTRPLAIGRVGPSWYLVGQP